MQIHTEQNFDALAGELGEALAREEKVCIVVAPDGSGGAWEGGINGYFFRIARGVRVEVPRSLAALIGQSARVEEQAKAAVDAYCSNGGKKLGR